MTDDNDDDGVGYGRPPKHTRFKPGQSGNPRGRPKGVKSFKTEVREIMRSRVLVNDGGKPRRVASQRAALLLLREEALSLRKARSLKEFIDLGRTHSVEDTPLSGDNEIPPDDAAILEEFLKRTIASRRTPTARHPRPKRKTKRLKPKKD